MAVEGEHIIISCHCNAGPKSYPKLTALWWFFIRCFFGAESEVKFYFRMYNISVHSKTNVENMGMHGLIFAICLSGECFNMLTKKIKHGIYGTI